MPCPLERLFCRFAGNRLRSLPQDMGALVALRSLDLRFNDLLLLPASCTDLSRLTALKLGGNLKVRPSRGGDGAA